MGYMFNMKASMFALLALAVLSGAVFAQNIIGTSTIRAPAVIISNETGSLTTFNLVVQKGNGSVRINGPAIVGNSTIQSALAAAQYGSFYLGLNETKYNFTYTIEDSAANVSGPSAGAAMTVLAISALSNKPLLSNFTMTGTIENGGQIGEIGGVYDKAAAAKAANLSYILVPAAPAGSLEAELYDLVQDNFQIPLVQVANITQAYKFASGKFNIQANKTTYPVLTLPTLSIKSANLTCSNDCNISQFEELTNFTLSFTNSSINFLNSNPNFADATTHLHAVLNNAEGVTKLGYLYAGADLAFLNYIDSFYFNSHNTNYQTGLNTLYNIQTYCDNLTLPQLTSTNYEYIIGGELRQDWGNYTINQSISSYNGSVETTDDVLGEMREAAQANGWCNAATEMYNIASNTSGTPAIQGSLSDLAAQRVAQAQEAGPGLYTITAQQADNQSNYMIAIISSDYQIALSNSLITAGLPTNQTLTLANQFAQNSTYGIWATEFANEAEFYIQESQQTSNASLASYYATQALSSALLAHQISPDMKTIYSSFEYINPGGPIQNLTNSTNMTNSTNSTSIQTPSEQNMSYQTLTVASLAFLIAIILIVFLLHSKYVRPKGKQKRRSK